MPVLSNPRHERFAQELANGKTGMEAHKLAGYKKNMGTPSTLKKDPRISKRVAEILAERERIHGQSTAKAIESVGLTKAWVIDRLVENVSRALQKVSVTDHDGKPTGEYRYEGSVANRGLELLGKELGMFVERHMDVTEYGSLEQILAELDSIAARGGSHKSGKPH